MTRVRHSVGERLPTLHVTFSTNRNVNDLETKMSTLLSSRGSVKATRLWHNRWRSIDRMNEKRLTLTKKSKGHRGEKDEGEHLHLADE